MCYLFSVQKQFELQSTQQQLYEHQQHWNKIQDWRGRAGVAEKVTRLYRGEDIARNTRVGLTPLFTRTDCGRDAPRNFPSK